MNNTKQPDPVQAAADKPAPAPAPEKTAKEPWSTPTFKKTDARSAENAAAPAPDGATLS